MITSKNSELHTSKRVAETVFVFSSNTVDTLNGFSENVMRKFHSLFKIDTPLFDKILRIVNESNYSVVDFS